MFGLSAGLEIARRALRAHQLTLNVLGGNIANVETPGYSRRRAELRPGMDIQTPSGSMGTGVDVVGVSRARDGILDKSYRGHHTDFGRWGSMQESLSRVESAFPADDSTGLGPALAEYWKSWSDLANQPESGSARIAVREKARALTDTFKRLDSHLDSLVEDINGEIGTGVDRVNSIATRLGALNAMVVAAKSNGDEPSGLLDERDRLVDELAGLANVQVEENAAGSITVHLGSEVLVQGPEARALEVADPGSGSTAIRWQDTKQSPVLAGGRLSGLLTTRDDRIAAYRQALDDIAAGLIAETNRIHAAGTGLDGSTGHNFFDPTRVHAGDIRIDAAIEGDVNLIAASAGGERGDGRQALAMAQIAGSKLLGNGTETLGSAYRSMVGRIGLDTSQAQSFQDAQGAILDQIDAQRADVSGVSLDEEMTQMMATQHAYQAMVRVTTTIDQMLDSIVRM